MHIGVFVVIAIVINVAKNAQLFVMDAVNVARRACMTNIMNAVVC
jgi:hypothetical protein